MTAPQDVPVPSPTVSEGPGLSGGKCQCCEREVGHLHWMEWDTDLSWLCGDCMESALNEEPADV